MFLISFWSPRRFLFEEKTNKPTHYLFCCRQMARQMVRFLEERTDCSKHQLENQSAEGSFHLVLSSTKKDLGAIDFLLAAKTWIDKENITGSTVSYPLLGAVEHEHLFVWLARVTSDQKKAWQVRNRGSQRPFSAGSFSSSEAYFRSFEVLLFSRIFEWG